MRQRWCRKDVVASVGVHRNRQFTLFSLIHPISRDLGRRCPKGRCQGGLSLWLLKEQSGPTGPDTSLGVQRAEAVVFICRIVLVPALLPFRLSLCREEEWSLVLFGGRTELNFFIRSLPDRNTCLGLTWGVPYDTLARLGQTRPIAVAPVLLTGHHSLSTPLASLSGPPGRVPMFAGSPAPLGYTRVAGQMSSCLGAD